VRISLDILFYFDSSSPLDSNSNLYKSTFICPDDMQAPYIRSTNINDSSTRQLNRLGLLLCVSTSVKNHVMKYLVINKRCGTCVERLRGLSQICPSAVLCDSCLNDCVQNARFTCGYCHRSQITMQLTMNHRSSGDCRFTCNACDTYNNQKQEMVQIYTKKKKLSDYISRCAMDIRENATNCN